MDTKKQNQKRTKKDKRTPELKAAHKEILELRSERNRLENEVLRLQAMCQDWYSLVTYLKKSMTQVSLTVDVALRDIDEFDAFPSMAPDTVTMAKENEQLKKKVSLMEHTIKSHHSLLEEKDNIIYELGEKLKRGR
jgi:chromosome segregation ATPase